MKKVCYGIGGFILLCALIRLTAFDIYGIVSAITLLSVALIMLPTFDMFCKLINKSFSIGRKIALGIGTFILPIMFVSEPEKANVSDIFITLGIIVVYWLIMVLTNKRSYIDSNSESIIKTSNKKGFLYNLYNKRIEKHNARVQAELEYEQEIRNNFIDLDVITMHTLAKMISETKEKHKSIFNEDMPEINISNLVMSFCKDTQRFENEYQLNNLYTAQYYINKINKECYQLSNYIKTKIKESLSRENKNKNVAIYSNYLNVFMDSMETFAEIKFYRNISSNADELEKYKDYGVPEDINYTYRNCFIYLIDLMATCTCIAKMIFIERKVSQLNHEHEFYKIISNMAHEISDIDTIINKSKPIYEEFYKSELGFINNNLHYSIAITIMANRINNNPFSKKDETILNEGLEVNEKINDFDSYNAVMRKWISVVADKYRSLDIEKYIIFKTIHSIELQNFDLFFQALSNVNEYANIYYVSVDHNNKTSDKERYLKGDFEKEKKELSGKYSLNNLTTGTQFELYLVNLFKDLGYKVKHNGKAGDQGCDLIVKKGDYVYAIQAKFYTGKLSNTPVQEISGSLKYYNANQGVVITNSSFTLGAYELAKANNVILIDGKNLKKLIDYTFENDKEEDFLKKFEK